MADDLAARVAALEQLVAELRLELAKRTGGFRSMRDSRRCPACGCEGLLHVREMATTSSDLATAQLALDYELTWRGAKSRGPMEAFVCRKCGLVELHALGLEDVVADGRKIVAVEPENVPNEGPYR